MNQGPLPAPQLPPDVVEHLTAPENTAKAVEAMQLFLRRSWALTLLAVGLSLPKSGDAQPDRIASPLPTIELRQGLVITKSARVAPRIYQLPAPSSHDSAVIRIRGDSITLDFAGATMEGMAPDSNPDIAAGVAIRVEGGTNVRILNAHIRGYKFGILALGTHNLSLIDNDLSYNWKPRLYSVIEHESLIDWLSFHHNEKDEWLRYGAGAYLRDVDGGEIRGNTVTQGMNGLMLVRSNGLTIWNNNFSFNSGLGIGLYRSNGNRIVHDRVNYDVRGYSEGFYRRGQDAADLLIYEQSSKNIVAYNSMTHGGDGVFLWAGQSTMDTGAGGANDNLFYGNDFSFAPANGIEATFSRNTFIHNRIEGCEYGVWGGYSFNSTIVGNHFMRNRTGIAIEHGQDNLIAWNTFLADSTAIRVWGDPIEPSDWGYPKHRDTRSRDYRTESNLFTGNRVGVRAANTVGLSIGNNWFVAVDSLLVVRDSTKYELVRNTVSASASSRIPRTLPIPPEFAGLAPPPIKNGFVPSREPATSMARRPRSAIIVDEWGPYDWRSPKLWPLDSSRGSPLRLRILGPAGRWRSVGQRGIASVTPTSGRVTDTIQVMPKADSVGDWDLTLEYVGSATVSPRGERRAAGNPYRFSYSRFEPPIDWNVRFYKWSDSTRNLRKEPASPVAFGAATPILSLNAPRLDFEGYRALRVEVPREFFALEAMGSVDLAPGEYTLRTISDDGVRVWVDSVLVIDNWSPHESALDFGELRGGDHDIRVQYYQADGWYELRVDIVRGRDRSPGSPGAHGAD
ncbi:MAG TPA: right-handed parallel beta-helix repeat-containing protein [Gemmatimonadaceae bacterium]|jgi:nitrous oxidase accessory protein NosD